MANKNNPFDLQAAIALAVSTLKTSEAKEAIRREFALSRHAGGHAFMVCALMACSKDQELASFAKSVIIANSERIRFALSMPAKIGNASWTESGYALCAAALYILAACNDEGLSALALELLDSDSNAKTVEPTAYNACKGYVGLAYLAQYVEPAKEEAQPEEAPSIDSKLPEEPLEPAAEE